MKMLRMMLFALLPAALVTGSALAEDYGTPDEAKAMLERAVVALNAEKDAALQNFIARSEGFGEKDLYVYCGDADGNFSAHYNKDLMGKSLKDLKDKDGKAFGEEIYSSAQEGAITEVEYKWYRPNSEEIVDKVAYVTKVDDQICAVGYYK